MDDWAHEQNIAKFEKRLATETDPYEKQILNILLQREYDRLRATKAKARQA
ncbi:hypothetical protein [Sphingobium nicotianae]|uniref:Uncharacterized protein n=1 Tax=Sphingobium nicotianae TaxID=2782607 RepID=A0A9X1DCY7_9SPHN|nr:hypothetical protein [Sphingobium nicotianae]MBT2187862.1 hypothetical protein [Sphingobium nicotianae]